MASRPILTPYPVVLDGDMSDDITSDITILTNLSMISYDISWTGTSPIGTISAQVSNSYSKNADGSTRDEGNWTTLPGTSAAITGNSGSGFMEIDAAGAYAIRLFYDRTSGVGVLNVKVNGKVR